MDLKCVRRVLPKIFQLFHLSNWPKCLRYIWVKSLLVVCCLCCVLTNTYIALHLVVIRTVVENWESILANFRDYGRGLNHVLFRNKNILFFKIESWNFQHLFEKINHTTDRKNRNKDCLNELNELKVEKQTKKKSWKETDSALQSQFSATSLVVISILSMSLKLIKPIVLQCV